MIRAMRIDDEFTAELEIRTVARLYRNGTMIVDTDGRPAEYASLEEAEYVARNWHVYGGVPLFDLSDSQLEERVGHMRWLDRGRALLHR